MEGAKSKSRSKRSKRDSNLLDTDDVLLHTVKKMASVMNNKNKEAFLSNNDIIQILKKAFNISHDNKNELEMDIYMSVIKDSIRKWPHWNILDKIVKASKTIKGFDIDKALNDHCSHLKQYLSYTMQLTGDEMKVPVQQYKKKLEENKAADNVAMEIQCSRQQLNHLVFRHPQPHPLTQNTMFTINETGPKNIFCGRAMNLKYVLNCPNVMISITLPGFKCMRHNTSNIEYTLVNKKKKGNSNRNINEKFDVNNIYLKKSDSKADALAKKSVIEYIKNFQIYIEKHIRKDANRELTVEYAKTILNEFLLDVGEAPKILLPGEYQYYLNGHNYFRTLYQEVPKADIFIGTKNYKDCFDMHIEELLTPMQRFSFTHIDPSKIPQATKCINNDTIPWLKIKCFSCSIEFELFYLYFDEVFKHFAQCQGSSPGWECANCAMKFTTYYLTNFRWKHTCK